MPEVPRDPRQLARDILSGKVRIEDLARERQMRQGGAGPARPTPPAARVPDRIPLPRPASPQRPAPRPAARGPAPVRPVQRQPVPARPAPARQAPARPVPPPIPGKAFPQAAPRPSAPAPAQPVVTGSAPPSAAPRLVRFARVQDLARSKKALRQGILISEILGKPLALRDETLF